MKIDQIMITVLSIVAVLLTQQTLYPDLTKYAPVVGMCSQPFWIYTSMKCKQTGILIISILYVFVWGLGIYNNFL